MAITSEDLFTAIKTIVDKQIDKVHYDKTIVCTIEDNSKASQGEYTVSDGSTSFTAYSEKTNYTKGAGVYVTIPQGNYENKKLIIGKYLGDDSIPYSYTPPTENYVNMTGNIIPESSNVYRLLANDVDLNNNPTSTSAIVALTDLSLIGYDRLGLSADFQTLLGSYELINGHYGLKMELTGIRNDGKEGYEVLYLNTDDMFGNPYKFVGATTQEKVFDISNYSEIQDINIYFYQSADFIDNNNEYIKYKIPGTDQKLIENLLVSNIQLSAGYDYSSFDKETILLYTLNSKIFSAEDSKRNLQVRFIQLNEQGTYSQMDEIPYIGPDSETPITPEGQEDSYAKVQELSDELTHIEAQRDAAIEALNEEDYPNDEAYLNAVTLLIEEYAEMKLDIQRQITASLGQYIIHWYQWDLAPDVQDEIAGPFWKEIYPQSAYNCDVELRGTAKAHERFKVIIEVNVASDGEGMQKRYIESQILEFTNENGSVETNLAVDLVSGLTLGTNDDYNGIYAIYGSDGQLMNQADAMKDRYVTVSYQSLVTGLTEFDGAESIMWQIPGNNTMIIIPEEQDGLTITQDPLTKVITLQGDINTSEDDTDIIGENNIRGAKLKFRINSVYSQINTNNTVKCLITRQGFQYAAQMTMHFAPAGTNGTDYTLILEIDNNQDYTAIPLDGEGTFSGLRIVAQLQDYENKPIEGKIGLSFEDDSGLIFPESTNEEKKTISINAGETALISKNGQVSGYGMVVATTYVWVANKVAEDKATEEEDENGETKPTSRQIMLTAYLPLSYAASSYTFDLLEGPIRVMYDGGGSNPVYTKLPYNLYTGGVLRTEKINWFIRCQNNGEEKYIGKINDGLYIPPVMLITGLGPAWVEGKINNDIIWKQRILLQVNRFGSSMLNRWDGSLTIDEENNQILSSIIGAGSKDGENRFTGVIMGDIGKDIDGAKTGLYGYHTGEQSFGFLSDGTAFLGKMGKGQIQFNGNKGTIQSGNYQKDKEGMLIDLDDALFDTKLFKVNGKLNPNKPNQSVLEIYGFNQVNNDNTEISNFENANIKPLMKVGNGKYFLQSANFDESIFTGFQLNLAKNKIIGFNTKLDFYNTGSEKIYLPSGKIAKKNIPEAITVHYTEDGVLKSKPFDCYYSEDLDLKENNNYYCGQGGNGSLDIFEGLKDTDWCEKDDIKKATAISVGDYESLLTIDSGAKQYPLWIQSSSLNENNNEIKNKTFKLGWDGSMQATSGLIGGWVINSNSLTTNGGKIGMAGWTDRNGPIFWSGGKALDIFMKNKDKPNNDGTKIYWNNFVGFGVDSNGNVYANQGYVGSWAITDGKLIGGDISYKDEHNVITNEKITLNANGDINARNITASLNGWASAAYWANNSGQLSGLSASDFAASGHTHTVKVTYDGCKAIHNGTYGSSGVTCSCDGSGGASGGGGGGCFAPGTKIIMADKFIKNIEDIKIGDIVIAYDEINKQFVPKKVIKSYAHYNTPRIIEVKFIDGNSLLMTPGHPIYTYEGWKSRDIENSLYEHGIIATWLDIYDLAIGYYNQFNNIISIKEIIIPNNYISYNIEVEDCHTFIANGIIVHNGKVIPLPY